MAGWQAYLPAGRSHAPNDDDSVVVVVLAVLYSGGVWERRVGVLGVVRGEWRWWGRGLTCSPFLPLPISFSSSPHSFPSSSPPSSSSSLVTLAHGARQSLDCRSRLCEA